MNHKIIEFPSTEKNPLQTAMEELKKTASELRQCRFPYAEERQLNAKKIADDLEVIYSKAEEMHNRGYKLHTEYIPGELGEVEVFVSDKNGVEKKIYHQTISTYDSDRFNQEKTLEKELDRLTLPIGERSEDNLGYKRAS